MNSIGAGIVDGLGFGDNTKAALLTRRIVEMPICDEVHNVLFEGKDPAKAVRDLMTRQLKDEVDW